EQRGRERVLLRRRQPRGTRDEHDRERVRDRPDHEREIPEEVAPREIDVALDDAAETDELLPERHSDGGHQPNTSLYSSSSLCSSSKVRPVAAKNASSSVPTR